MVLATSINCWRNRTQCLPVNYWWLSSLLIWFFRWAASVFSFIRQYRLTRSRFIRSVTSFTFRSFAFGLRSSTWYFLQNFTARCCRLSSFIIGLVFKWPSWFPKARIIEASVVFSWVITQEISIWRVALISHFITSWGVSFIGFAFIWERSSVWTCFCPFPVSTPSILWFYGIDAISTVRTSIVTGPFWARTTNWFSYAFLSFFNRIGYW